MKTGTEAKAEAKTLFQAICAKRGLKLTGNYFNALRQTADWLVAQIGQERRTLGIAGAQGSGKSTFASILREFLSAQYKVEAEVLSLDDFYLTRAERQELTAISPMLATRGVPGTHDLSLAFEAIARFKSGEIMRVPEFSKPHDDRQGYREVPTLGLQLLILEGWCWGAKPQAAAELLAPVNKVEAEMDADGSWRHYVNEQLKAYQPLFQTDASLFLAVPDFSAVKRWRWQQEEGLPDGPARMSESEVERFIMFYQRITEQLLATRPSEVDICLSLDEHHDVTIERFPDS